MASNTLFIHENPVVAGIVYEPQQYVYSSAIDYYDNSKLLVNITYLEQSLINVTKILYEFEDYKSAYVRKLSFVWIGIANPDQPP